MSTLSVTLIDVGWGDSLLLAWEDGTDRRFGLIDSNDTTYLQSSYIFLKRFFEKAGVDVKKKPVFEFVILSHAHADHGQGLQGIMRQFGTTNFWYPKSAQVGSMATLIRFAQKSSNVKHHQAIDDTKILPKFGDADLTVLWPPYNQINPNNENNNSIVLTVAHGSITLMLTGDAEGDVWQQIGTKIPAATRVFKVPHHGSVNGTFFNGGTPWLDHCPQQAKLAISSHVRPFSHPDTQVIDELNTRNYAYYRTDEHYHLRFKSDGNNVELKYSHE